MQFFWQLSRFIILFLINPKDFPCLHYGAPFWHLSMYTILTNSELWESYPTIWEILVGFLIKIKNTTWRVAVVITFFFAFFSFIFISWRLITLQYCSGFCHTLTWISHGFTCIPHPDPPSHLPLHPLPLGLPSAPGPSTCLMHLTWAGDLFHPR